MSAAASLAEIIRTGLPDLLQHYAHRLTGHQRRALSRMAQCRTGAFGETLLHCRACQHTAVRLRSCGHRSCPTCQQHTASQWLARQSARLLPVDYFMATFTVPRALRPVAYREPERVYPLLFAAVADTLKSFGLRHPKLAAEIGFSIVLHTHSRRLEYHPHLHVVIPGGGVATEHNVRLWRSLEARYLFNGFAVAEVFRGKLLAALRRANIPLPNDLPNKWVVHCKHVGSGLPALKYLARYLYRGVISEQDLSFDRARRTVTFRYRDSKSRQYRRRTLTLTEFLWRIAVHVLPRGLQRVRHYGFLHGNAGRLLASVQLVLRVRLPDLPKPSARPFLCPHCRAPMRPGPLPMLAPG